MRAPEPERKPAGEQKDRPDEQRDRGEDAGDLPGGGGIVPDLGSSPLRVGLIAEQREHQQRAHRYIARPSGAIRPNSTALKTTIEPTT